MRDRIIDVWLNIMFAILFLFLAFTLGRSFPPPPERVIVTKYVYRTEVACNECNGTGKITGIPCKYCDEDGNLTLSGRNFKCPLCNGTKKRLGDTCPDCQGHGKMWLEEVRDKP